MLCMTVKWLLLFVITQWPLYSNGIDQLVVVDESTNPMELSRQICINSRDSCQNLVLPLIQLEKYSLFNIKLDNWRHNEACGCLLPPQTKQSYLQYFHIPKSGTSINWFFRDYFENCNDEVNVRVNVSGDPCPTWLETEEQQAAGLCNGRLFSCMGHAVTPDLPNIVMNSPTNVVTFLREPFARLQSDFHYISTHPKTGHLGKGVNVTHLLSYIADTPSSDNKMLRFATYPGIANCATKMLNGYQCGDAVRLDESHLQVAISVLDHFLFYGITEYFQESVCLLAFTYGGVPMTRHFGKYRVENYTSRQMKEVFTSEDEQNAFTKSEFYDLQLYRQLVVELTNQAIRWYCQDKYVNSRDSQPIPS